MRTVRGRSSRGMAGCTAQGLSVDGNNFARRQPGNRGNQGDEAVFQFLPVQRRKHAVEGRVRRDAGGQGQERFQPLPLGLAVLGDVVPTLRTAQYRSERDQQDLFQ